MTRETHRHTPNLAKGANLPVKTSEAVSPMATLSDESNGRTKVKKLRAWAVLLVGRLARMGNCGAAYKTPMPTETMSWKPIQSRVGELTWRT